MHFLTEDTSVVCLVLQSLVDESGLKSINKVALKSAEALSHCDGKLATSLWDEAEKIIDGLTSGVNLYNILKWNDDNLRALQHRNSSRLLLDTVLLIFI